MNTIEHSSRPRSFNAHTRQKWRCSALLAERGSPEQIALGLRVIAGRGEETEKEKEVNTERERGGFINPKLCLEFRPRKGVGQERMIWASILDEKL